ncbi:MAG: carboxypeptidase-like regulatory domain-containing protein, partial [Blastocatellia bacterium]
MRTPSVIAFGAAFGGDIMKISEISLGSFVKVIQTLGVVVGLFLFCRPGFSQANLGSILGAVTDQSGAPVAGCKVTVSDLQRGISRLLVTDDAGQYSAPNLLPGSYTVRAEYKGFQTVERQNILMEVGKDIRVDITLR